MFRSAAVPAVSTGPVPSAVIDYTYQLLTPQATGLVQVFDDGRWTYVSFEAQTPPGLMVFDNEGREVPFHAVGRTVVLDTVRRGWLIRTPTVSSYAQSRESQTVAQEGTEATALPVDLAAARAEILADLTRLEAVSAELNRSQRGAQSPPIGDLKAQIDQIQTQLDGVNATLVRAVFPPGSAALTISEETQQALLVVARQARWIQIKGGADSTGSAEVNVHLALARAQVLQHLLIAGGVAAEKVSISASAQDYAASNTTRQGRALNRRADVYFIGRTEAVMSLKLPSNPDLKSEGTVAVPVVVQKISDAGRSWQ